MAAAGGGGGEDDKLAKSVKETHKCLLPVRYGPTIAVDLEKSGYLMPEPFEYICKRFAEATKSIYIGIGYRFGGDPNSYLGPIPAKEGEWCIILSTKNSESHASIGGHWTGCVFAKDKRNYIMNDRKANKFSTAVQASLGDLGKGSSRFDVTEGLSKRSQIHEFGGCAITLLYTIAKLINFDEFECMDDATTWIIQELFSAELEKTAQASGLIPRPLQNIALASSMRRTWGLFRTNPNEFTLIYGQCGRRCIIPVYGDPIRPLYRSTCCFIHQKQPAYMAEILCEGFHVKTTPEFLGVKEIPNKVWKMEIEDGLFSVLGIGNTIIALFYSDNTRPKYWFGDTNVKYQCKKLSELLPKGSKPFTGIPPGKGAMVLSHSL